MTQLLSIVSEVNSYNTTASLSDDLNVPNASLNRKKRTFQWRAIEICNGLPVSLMVMNMYGIFFINNLFQDVNGLNWGMQIGDNRSVL